MRAGLTFPVGRIGRYLREKRKDNQYVNIFGGAYSSRNNMKVVNSPYNVVYNNIFDDNN